ncbi:hypothetical protein CpipJ_CPIJ006928 [Culex quinquefasciatus]|uniref:Uncharacterized protein n=1 Tax=Culex quinquefasciatus TaxID=7176 RepID=B0WIJ9_CULQU|nr:hypothetical protein CpipJ_CPIJ006928 [Culex quinquefasciatus]|eukprot:XP_001848533.1 hypothetical protein CpipJ_CPIJ006928 [Culex quinquefasciatus]
MNGLLAAEVGGGVATTPTVQTGRVKAEHPNRNPFLRLAVWYPLQSGLIPVCSPSPSGMFVPGVENLPR